MYIHFIKPVFDWIFALICTIILSPVLILFTIILTIINDRKVFFFQQRPGQNGKIFLLLKFKTLLDKRDETGGILPDNMRQFRFGTFLRHYHFDELPQLINVLKGEMQIIGPRPLLVEYLPYYNDIQNKRHLCKPGIIGLSQVMGGNRLSWLQRLRLDVFYVEHESFALDLQIVMRTFKYFFQKEKTADIDSIFSLESFIDFRNNKKN